MAPEKVFGLIAINLRMENGRLIGDGERVTAAGPLYVSWYARSPGEAQLPIAGGLVHVHDTPSLYRHPIRDAEPADLGDSYRWRDASFPTGPLMFALSMPSGYTLVHADPVPMEAKEYRGTLAAFWKPPSQDHVQVRWSMGKLTTGVLEEVRRINREGLDQLLPTRQGTFEWDVALSYASEDAAYVDAVARFLKEAGVNVFQYGSDQVTTWGTNLSDHLKKVYSAARYSVLFISKHYVDKTWTNVEKRSALGKAFREKSTSVLPARFDDTHVPDLEGIGWISLDEKDPKEFADLIIRKVQSSNDSAARSV